jgi:hypothetical protein
VPPQNLGVIIHDEQKRHYGCSRRGSNCCRDALFNSGRCRGSKLRLPGRLLPTEAVICSDETLSALDRALAASYKRKFDSLSASQRYELESAEKVRLAERNSCGTNKSCITNAYAIRISQLGG